MIPKISVYVLCHNYAKYLEACLSSISNQIFTDWELIILDDGSSDNSLEIIREFKSSGDQKVTIIHNEHALGLKSASNHDSI